MTGQRPAAQAHNLRLRHDKAAARRDHREAAPSGRAAFLARLQDVGGLC
jgi:hypothetical protein